ncbi:MAG: YecA family protein, partial [Candidatus Devosia euplotis]|nr:YecA family protein [Candidatus Devosia euplotis]
MPESEPTPATITDDDYEVEHSPLEREVARDGTTVEICIYRGPDCSPRWLLEVEDETGGSTVWDEPFETDQEALDAALKAIDEEGIGSFAEGTTSHEARSKLWALQCSESPLADIRRALDVSPEMMGLHEAAGVCAAVATAPTVVRPSAWMDMVKGEHIFEGMQEVQGFSQGVMALYNEVQRSVGEQHAHCVPTPTDQEAVRQFCQGYIAIAADDPTWEADERA